MSQSASKVIFLIGFMGSGKSHGAKLLSDHTGLPYVDLDDWIEDKEQRTITAIFNQSGEAYFRERESAALKEAFASLSAGAVFQMGEQGITGIISTGGGTPCYHENMKWMNQHGITVWLNPLPSVLMQRLLQEKVSRPLVAALSENELTLFVTSKLSERISFYSQAAIELQDEVDVELLIEKIKNA
jgi:shikimate kinase